MAPPATVAVAIASAGDVLSQLVVESRENLNTFRLALCAGLGGALEGFVGQEWYRFLHVRLPGQRILQRLFLHHFTFAPLLLIPVFIATTAAVEGHAPPWLKLKQEWFRAVCAHWVIMIPTQLVAAFWVPKSFQVLSVNIGALLWSTTLSWLNHRQTGDCNG